MLSEARIKELKELELKGREAKELIAKNKDLTDRKDCLENIKNKLCNCLCLQIQTESRTYTEIGINDPDFALKHVKEILQREIEIINERLKEIK